MNHRKTPEHHENTEYHPTNRTPSRPLPEPPSGGPVAANLKSKFPFNHKPHVPTKPPIRGRFHEFQLQ